MQEDLPVSDVAEEPPDLLETVRRAAIEAELQTGRREETLEEAERNVLIRVARIIGGFALIIAGVAAIVLPGPGWLLIVLGLSLLPFAWAQRTIRLIRRKVPGVPEEGRVPTRSLVIMGTMLVTFVALSALFADDVTGWIRGFGDPDSLLG